MRSPKASSRNKSNRNRNNPGNVINRVFDSSGPEGKVRGTPQQIIEKYSQLTRDAFLSNDRVAGENFQQHAEHYTRLLAEAQREIDARREQAEQQNRERQQRDRDARAEKAAEVMGEGEQPDLLVETSDNNVEAAAATGEKPEKKQRRSSSRPKKPRKPQTEAADSVNIEENAAATEASNLVETVELQP